MVAITIITLILLVIAALFALGLLSKSGEAGGFVEGRLSRCPNSPNCVCSEYGADAAHYIEPLDAGSADPAQTLARLKTIIRETGGRIQQERDDYLAATFSSAIFGFVDDVEIRVDRANNLIHLRSASRVGRGDGGVNRKRVEQLKKSYRAQNT